MTACTWLVCEVNDRWQRTVERFAPEILPGGYECLPGSPEEVRVRAAHTPALVILYELSRARSRETLHSIAACASRPEPPLQLVALELDFPRDAEIETQLAAQLRILGATAVLRHPEQLPLLGRLVAHYVARCSTSNRGDFDNRLDSPTLRS